MKATSPENLSAFTRKVLKFFCELPNLCCIIMFEHREGRGIFVNRTLLETIRLLLALETVYVLSAPAVYSQHSSSYSVPSKQFASAPTGRATGSVNRPITDKWALVVGVGKFQDAGIPSLRFAEKDAHDFAEFLIKEQHFARDHVVVRLNEQATRREILSLIGDKFFPRVVKPDDLVVLFYSSHGSPAGKDVAHENFILTHDTELGNLFATAIDMQDLTRILRERAGADRVLIVMDACHSGGGAVGAKSTELGANMDFRKIPLGEGQCVISSSSADQRSWESTRYQNGVFTHNLIEGLRKTAKLEDAIKLTCESVADEVQQDQAMEQTPQINHNKWKGNELVLAVPPAEPRPLPETVKKLIDEGKRSGAGGASNGSRSETSNGHKDMFREQTTSAGSDSFRPAATHPAVQSPATQSAVSTLPPPIIERPSLQSPSTTYMAPPVPAGQFNAPSGAYRSMDGNFAVNIPGTVQNRDLMMNYGMKHLYMSQTPSAQYFVWYNEHNSSSDPTYLRDYFSGLFLGDKDMTGFYFGKNPRLFTINGYPAAEYLLYSNFKKGKVIFCATNIRSYAFWAYVPNSGDPSILNSFFNSISIR
jgi:hypothetical protein